MIRRIISGRLRAAASTMRRLSSASSSPEVSSASASRGSFASPPPPPPRTTLSATADLAEEDFVLSDSVSPPASAAAAAMPSLLQPRVLVYDGVCHLCNRGVKRVIEADKYEKIKFCCLQSKAAEPYLHVCGLNREDVLRRVLFVEGPESYYQGSAAALKVASYLPFPYSVLSALVVIPTPLRDAVYDYIAKRRYDWFGKEDKCIVMRDKKLLERFIDREEMLGSWDDI